MEPRSRSFYVLTAFFMLFILFLYGPTITIGILSFQGPGGGLTFPMRGVSMHWFYNLFEHLNIFVYIIQNAVIHTWEILVLRVMK